MSNKFIVFEGIDGSGKTTLINELKKTIDIKKYFFTREPGGTDLKEHVYAALQLVSKTDESLIKYLLFASERAHHIKTKILPALQEKKIVISDRFVDSSYVYQGDCSLNFMQRIFEESSFGIKPKITFFCKIKPQIAEQRILKRNNNNFLDEYYIKKLQTLHERYLKLYKDREDVISIDMTAPLLENINIICAHLEKLESLK
jgi:dTMP kinase